MTALEAIHQIEALPESEVRAVLAWAEKRAKDERQRKEEALNSLWELSDSQPNPGFTEEEVLIWPRKL